MTLDAEDILQKLLVQEPKRLNVLPRENGIYALHDHFGKIQYIGITIKDRYGFYGRINGRHVSGSEGRSHKFSHAYNTGRMWHAKKDVSLDAKLAKELRRCFVRKYCRATYLVIEAPALPQLPRVEIEVISAARKLLPLHWTDERSFAPLFEPTELLDILLKELRYSPSQTAAIERQAALYAKFEG